MSREETITELQTKAELIKLNGLLQDTAFTIKTAAYCEAAYTGAVPIKQNDRQPDVPIKKPAREEKTALYLTSLYAVECSAAAVCKRSGAMLSVVLEQMALKTLNAGYTLLLNAFAGATRQAALSFMELACIQQDNGVDLTDKKEQPVINDTHAAAARWLLLQLRRKTALLSVKEELAAIEKILNDKRLAEEAATYLATTHGNSMFDAACLLSLLHTETDTVDRSAREENIAINLAGFYALAYGLAYLSAVQKQMPSRIVADLLADCLPQLSKDLLERFANATWKAGQPFRDLDRITRDVFRPFDRLPEDELKKDWQQIRTVASLLSEEFAGAGFT